MQSKLGIVFTLLSALGYGSTAVIVINAYKAGATPWQVLLAQSTTSLGFILLLLFLRWKRVLELKENLPLLCSIGIFGYTSMAICYTLALQYLPGSLATLIFFTYPIFVALGARWFYGEKFTRSKTIALYLAIAGVVLTCQVFETGFGLFRGAGVILCLAAAAGATVLTLLSERLVRNNDPLDLALAEHFAAALALTLFIVFGRLAEWRDITSTVWLLGLLLTIITSLLPTFFALKGIAYLGATKASIVAVAEIPITLFLVFIFLQEQLTGAQWLGSSLIMGSVFILRKK
ncbi:MAG: DMT family transporter [Bacillota bacterium]|uniref:EamA family transporter n=1 Tax=Thermanaerosceptrum fracticalcis TaxID=1712410 RepID=A0A7G6E3J2_THEFR|nr:DMT family transporter [Thermanaerosceptrum fracticalcis]QNB46646.1 EamA family transporter [Thermanaerosceptrum fracticalcis]